MKKEEILKLAEEAAKKYREGDFFIGCKVDEVLPNNKTTTLICVDCSWLKPHQEAIIDRNDLDEVGEEYKKPTIKIDCEDFILTYWFDMVDMDGDVHHCKVESYIDTSEDPFNPIEGTSYVVYIEV